MLIDVYDVHTKKKKLRELIQEILVLKKKIHPF